MKATGWAVALALAWGCGGSGGSTTLNANPCATPGATYLGHFVEQSGTCGPIPDQIINVNPDGTLSSSMAVSCAQTTVAGCTTQNTDCMSTSAGSTCSVTSDVTFSPDGTSASGLETARCTYSGGSCTSTYNVTATRQSPGSGGDAGVPLCAIAGQSCATTPCCAGSLCVQDTITGALSCADTCSSGTDCMSGCCDTLIDTGQHVCGDMVYCLSSVGELCDMIGAALCQWDAACGAGWSTCLTDSYNSCCADTGTCTLTPSATATTASQCVLGFRNRDCGLEPNLPAACIGITP